MNPKITIVGRLGKDPEAIGTVGTKFTVATNDRVKNETTGQWEDKDTSWWNIKAWRSLGEQAKATLKKGQEVIIVGTIYQENWTDTAGQKRTSYEINAESIAVTTHSLNRDSASTFVAAATPSVPEKDPWVKVDA